MVADLVSELIGRWPQVATIEFAVEDVPPSNPAAWESHNVVVARIFPADRRRGLIGSSSIGCRSPCVAHPKRWAR